MATAKKSAKSTPDAFEFVSSMSPDFLKEGYEKTAESVSVVVDFHKASLEALMTSFGSIAKGVEAATSAQVSFAKEAFEDGVAAANATASSKSIHEALDIQNDYIRAAFEKNVSQINKSTEQFMSVAKEASKPIADQYGELVEKVQAFRP